MKKDMSTPVYSSRSKTIYSILKFIYFIAWLFCIFILIFDFAFGSDSLLTIKYGKNIEAIIWCVALACALLPLPLKLMKKRKYRYLISFLFSLTFFSFYTIETISAQKYISDFTTDKWFAHPQFRFYMIEDLRENHNVIGMNKTEVIQLLGEPNYQNDSVFSYSLGRNGREFDYINVYFSNDIAINIDYDVVS